MVQTTEVVIVTEGLPTAPPELIGAASCVVVGVPYGQVTSIEAVIQLASGTTTIDMLGWNPTIEAWTLLASGAGDATLDGGLLTLVTRDRAYSQYSHVLLWESVAGTPVYVPATAAYIVMG